MAGSDPRAPGPTASARAFVALYPSGDQRRAIEQLIARLADGSEPRRRQAQPEEAGPDAGAAAPAVRVRWVPSHQAHLTLAFLGEVPRDALDGITQRLEGTVLAHAPFDLAYRGVGAFPDPRRPRVVWLGVGEGREPLAALAGNVRRALAPLGLSNDDRPFRPHLTLGRVRGRSGRAPSRRSDAGGDERWADLLARVAPDEGTEAAPVRRVALVTSRLGPHGAEHAVVAEVGLGG